MRRSVLARQPSVKSYLNIPAIISAAEITGAVAFTGLWLPLSRTPTSPTGRTFRFIFIGRKPTPSA
ncbi:hypothetical protein ACNKHK_21055 [Shigella flexneri]